MSLIITATSSLLMAVCDWGRSWGVVTGFRHPRPPEHRGNGVRVFFAVDEFVTLSHDRSLAKKGAVFQELVLLTQLKVLGHVTLDPRAITTITTAALVILTTHKGLQ